MLSMLLSFWLAVAPGFWFATSQKNAGTAATNTSVGSEDWFGASGATGATNSSGAETVGSAGGQSSYYLRLSNFGFSIPGGSTINGVRVQLRVAQVTDVLTPSTCTGITASFNRVRLVNESGTIGSTDKAAATAVLNDASWNPYDFGGTGDTWSGEASAINWNNSASGFVVSFSWSGTTGTCRTLVDSVNILVDYTPPAGAPRRTVISKARTIERAALSF